MAELARQNQSVPMGSPAQSLTAPPPSDQEYDPAEVMAEVTRQTQARPDLTALSSPQSLDPQLNSAFDAAVTDAMPRGPLNFSDSQPPPFQYHPGGINPSPNAGDLGPLKDPNQEYDPSVILAHHADQWEDPMWHPAFNEWKDVRDTRHQLGRDTVAYGVSQAPGVIGGLIQTAWGGLQEFDNLADDPTKNGLQKAAVMGSTALEGARKAAINTGKLAEQIAPSYYHPELLGGLDPMAPIPRPENIDEVVHSMAQEDPLRKEYDRYMVNKEFDREVVDPTITNLKPMGLPSPLPNLSDTAAMVLAPENAIAGVAGKMVQGAGISNVMKGATGRFMSNLGNKGVALDQSLANAAEQFSNTVENRTGITLPQIRNGAKWVGGLAGVGGLGAAVTTQNPDMVKAITLPLAAYVALKSGRALIRPTSRIAQRTGAIFQEAADPLGPLRSQAITDLTTPGAIPEQYQAALLNANSAGINSTPSRIANNVNLPAWERRMGQRLSNPLIVGSIRNAGRIAEGAAAGAATTLPFIAADPSNSNIGRQFGAGVLFGTMGSLGHRVVGGNAAEVNQDIARFLVDTHMARGDVQRTAALPPERLRSLAAFQGLVGSKGVDVIPLNAKDYEANTAALGGGSGSAGVFIDANPQSSPRIFINLDKPTVADLHELGEAINSSQVMGGQLRRDIRNSISLAYGPEKIFNMGREYIQRTLESEDKAATKLGQPVPAIPMQDRVTERMGQVQQESYKDPLRDAQDPMDWARDEIWAETVNTAGIDYNKIRANVPQGSSPMGPVRNILAGAARALRSIGVPISEQTGGVQAPISAIFQDNPLIGSNPSLQRQVVNYVKTYNNWLANINDESKGKAPRGTLVSPGGSLQEVIRSPFVKMHEGDTPGVTENEFLRTENGITTLKRQDVIDQNQRERDAQVENLHDPNVLLNPKRNPADAEKYGRRIVNGKEQIGGPRLPDNFFLANRMPKWIREFSQQMHDGMNDGTVWRALYHAIGTGDSGSFKIKNLGNFEAIQRDVVPFYFFKSGAKKLLVNVLDVTALNGKLYNALNNGKLGLFGHDLNQFRRDLQQYFNNHKQGLPGSNGLGTQKEAVINGMLFTDTKDHKLSNPLYREFGTRGVIRSFRLDRLEDMQPALDPNGDPQKGFHFDYDKVKFRLMPDAVDPTVPLDKKSPPRAMPDVADDGSNGSKSISRQYGKYPKGTEVKVIGVRSKDPLNTNILVRFPDGKEEKFPIDWLKSPKGQMTAPKESLPQLVNRLGREGVNDLLAEWDNAELSPDGNYIMGIVDPRSSMKQERIPVRSFLEWVQEKQSTESKVNGQNALGIANDEGGFSSGLPRRNMASSGRTNIDEKGNVTYQGKAPNEWTPEDFKGFGEDFGVGNLGPLSPVKRINDELGRPVAEIPGGLDGKFTYYDLLHLKANPVDVKTLPVNLHAQLTAKLARTMTPEKGNLVQRFNGLIFGMLSPNAPLLPNEIGQARLRMKSMDDIKRFADLLPDNPTKEQSAALNTRLKDELGFKAEDNGGLGIPITADLSNVVKAAKMFVKNPDFFIKRPDESWASFVDKLTTQVGGLGTKTASFAGVWQDPLMASISAMDRHMARIFSDELVTNPEIRKSFEGIVLKRFNTSLEKSQNVAREFDKKIKRASGDKLQKLQENRAKALKKLPDPTLSKAGTLDDVLGQADIFGADKVKDFLNEAVFSAMGSRKAKLMTKKGINPNLPDSIKGVEWVETPKEFQVMSDAYRAALELNANRAKEMGIEIFPAQWTLWDRIRQRVEPHEAMFPGLEKLPALNDGQLSSAYASNKAAGYMTTPKEGKKWKRQQGISPSELAYFGVPALIGGGVISPSNQQSD